MFRSSLAPKAFGACGRDISFLHHFPALHIGLSSLSPHVFVSDESNVFFVCFDIVALDTAKTNNEWITKPCSLCPKQSAFLEPSTPKAKITRSYAKKFSSSVIKFLP